MSIIMPQLVSTDNPATAMMTNGASGTKKQQESPDSECNGVASGSHNGFMNQSQQARGSININESEEDLKLPDVSKKQEMNTVSNNSNATHSVDSIEGGQSKSPLQSTQQQQMSQQQVSRNGFSAKPGNTSNHNNNEMNSNGNNHNSPNRSQSPHQNHSNNYSRDRRNGGGAYSNHRSMGYMRGQPEMDPQTEESIRNLQKSQGDINPDANLYIINFPPGYKEAQLRELFKEFGEIQSCRCNPVGDHAFAFIAFKDQRSAEMARKKMDGYTFHQTGHKLRVTPALRRKRSSLSEEPTNLYVKGLPKDITDDRLKQIFQQFGAIAQSKVQQDGIAFVRYASHQEALTAIEQLHGKTLEDGGTQLEVKFANRKYAANGYRNMDGQTDNRNNLYVRNLPHSYTQMDLEGLFKPFGLISSAKVNDNGVAFVRYMKADAAEKAVRGLSDTRPTADFEEDIVVKLAHYDIGDIRNRFNWKNDNNQNYTRFNHQVYANHLNTPMGHQYSGHQPFGPPSFINGSNMMQTGGTGGPHGGGMHQIPHTQYSSIPNSVLSGNSVATGTTGTTNSLAGVPGVNVNVLSSNGTDLANNAAMFGFLPNGHTNLGAQFAPLDYQTQIQQVAKQAQMNNLSNNGNNNTVFNNAVMNQLSNLNLSQMNATQLLLNNGNSNNIAAAQGENINNGASNNNNNRQKPHLGNVNQIQQLMQQAQAQAQAQVQGQGPPPAPQMPTQTQATRPPDSKQQIGDAIYQVVMQKYPDHAPKLTGMILQKGVENAKRYLLNQVQLNSVIEEAANTLKRSLNAASQQQQQQIQQQAASTQQQQQLANLFANNALLFNQQQLTTTQITQQNQMTIPSILTNTSSNPGNNTLLSSTSLPFTTQQLSLTGLAGVTPNGGNGNNGVNNLTLTSASMSNLSLNGFNVNVGNNSPSLLGINGLQNLQNLNNYALNLQTLNKPLTSTTQALNKTPINMSNGGGSNLSPFPQLGNVNLLRLSQSPAFMNGTPPIGATKASGTNQHGNGVSQQLQQS